ncbi:hypothetical protein RQP46_006309 [Phenoliferia psychrophenolica]
MDAADALAGIHLQRGQSLLSGIQDALAGLVYQSPTHSFIVQVWALYAIHLLVLLFSVIGIVARYRRGNGWIFVCDDSGYLRPNPALATQGLFAIYAIFFCIAAPLYPLKRAPTDSAFAWELVTFVPLGMAFHTVTWATALAPTTAAFLSNGGRPERSVIKGRIASTLAIVLLVLFIASLVPAFFLTTHYRAIVFTEVEAALAGIEIAIQSGASQTDALMTLSQSWMALSGDAQSLVNSHRQLIITFFSWALFWVSIYFPSAIRLLMTLVQRRQRLQRSLKSLKVLGELVTHDDLEAATFADATQLPALEPTMSRAEGGHRASSESGSSVKDLHISNTALVPLPSLPEADDDDVEESPMEFLSSQRPTSSPPQSLSSSFSTLAKSTSTSSFTALPRKVKSSNRPSTSGSQKIAAAKQFAEKMMDDFGRLGGSGSSESEREKREETDGTKSRGVEVRLALDKTTRLITTIGVQLFLCLTMVSSYLAFCILVLAGIKSPVEVNTLFITFCGWTFAGPALVGSLLFAILSIRDTPRTPSPTLSTAVINPDYSPSAASLTPVRTPSKRGRGRHYASARRPTTGDSTISASDALSSTAGVGSFSSDGGGGTSIRDVMRERAESRVTQMSFERAVEAVGVEMEEGGNKVEGPMRSVSQKWVPSAWAVERQKEKEGAGEADDSEGTKETSMD